MTFPFFDITCYIYCLYNIKPALVSTPKISMSRAPISLAFYYPCMICTLVSQAGGQKKRVNLVEKMKVIKTEREWKNTEKRGKNLCNHLPLCQQLVTVATSKKSLSLIDMEACSGVFNCIFIFSFCSDPTYPLVFLCVCVCAFYRETIKPFSSVPQAWCFWVFRRFKAAYTLEAIHSSHIALKLNNIPGSGCLGDPLMYILLAHMPIIGILPSHWSLLQLLAWKFRKVYLLPTSCHQQLFLL